MIGKRVTRELLLVDVENDANPVSILRAAITRKY
jgi:hypothetical protein